MPWYLCSINHLFFGCIQRLRKPLYRAVHKQTRNNSQGTDPVSCGEPGVRKGKRLDSLSTVAANSLEENRSAQQHQGEQSIQCSLIQILPSSQKISAAVYL